MNSTPEHFDRLQRLLQCKRYEQPPPGYFDELAERVITRLEELRTARTPSWWERLLSGLELKPVLAGACGLAVCGLVLAGIAVAQIGSLDAGRSGRVGESLAAAAPTALWSGRPGLFPAPAPLATASLSSMAPVVKQPASALVEGNTDYELTPVTFSFRIR